MSTSHGIALASVTLNASDPPALARFYEQLLGWKITTEEPDWVMLRNPDGGVGLNVQAEDLFVRPVWPATGGEQQMTMHLEILVDDLEAASAHAQACGATLAEYQPQEHVRVHFDPVGHPFCLFLE